MRALQILKQCWVNGKVPVVEDKIGEGGGGGSGRIEEPGIGMQQIGTKPVCMSAAWAR